MSQSDRLEQLERKLALATAEIERLAAKDAIRECIYRFYRGVDRIDLALLQSVFHDDAVVDYRPAYYGPFQPEALLTHQRGQFQAQHMVGQTTIQVDGDSAAAESYGLARHKNNIDGQWVDQIIGLRLFDRFTKRDGVWKISHRKQVTDWARVYPVQNGNDQIYEDGMLEKGARDPSDPSYSFLR